MASDEPAGSRTQLLSHLQQFMDMTLRDLAKASESKDADEKEIQAIRNVLLKILTLGSKPPTVRTILPEWARRSAGRRTFWQRFEKAS